MRLDLERNSYLIGLLLVALVGGACSPAFGAGEDVKNEAIEKASEESAIRMEQLSYERRQLLLSLLAKGEQFLLDGELDKAEMVFQAALGIVPDEKKAQAYLKYIKNLKRSLLRKEEERKAREELERLLEEKEDKQQALAKIRVEKKREKRKGRTEARKKVITTEQKIDQHLRQGKEYYAQEKYTEAIKEWEEILGLTHATDESHQRVLKWMHAAKIAEQRERDRQTLEKTKEFRKQVFLDVERGWGVKEPAAEKRREKKAEEVEEEISVAQLRLEKKAMQRVSLDFQNAHLRNVLTHLSKLSGINIVLDENVFPLVVEGEEISSRARVTIKLKDIPLLEILDVILRTKGLNYRLEENIVWITTEENLATGELVTRSYRPSGGIEDIADMLKKTVPLDTDRVEGADVKGPKNSYITVDKTAGIIFITNTEMNLRLAEDIIRKLSTAPLQAAIECRFMDVMSETIEDIPNALGIQWKFSEAFQGFSDDAYIGPYDTLGGKPQDGPGIDLGVDEIQQPHGIFMRYAKLTPTQFELVLQAFEGKEDTNVLSAPKITVLNNYEATIDISTEFPFIETYDIETETVEIGGDDFKMSVALPGNIATRRVGVMLRVTPGIGADRKTINLTLIPEVVEHTGWMLYGVSRFRVQQPIFSVRYVTTNVDINDGETLVLGGFIEGEEREADTTVPFFGRIPILGVLFRRKEMETQKRELLIFVTARIIEPTGLPLISD